MVNIIGQIFLKQFRVDSFIASGGMGAVYKVWDLKRNVPLAMKALHADLADDPSVFKRFEREAQALQQLRHPNIVLFYGLFQDQGQTFLLEEFIEGNSLQGILRARNGQPLPVDEAIIYMKGLCAATHYAHTNKVIHCDVKPGNVLVNRQGNIFLADFGIAKFIDATTTMTMGVAGTPSYMAPEQILGRGVTPLTDIYALGVVLFEMLTGQRPFRGTEAGSEAGGDTPSDRVRYAHLRVPPPDPRQINPNLSPVLSKMMLRGLNKNAAERFRSAQEFFFALCQASQAQPEQVADTTTIIGDFVSRPLQPEPVRRVATAPRPRKKRQEMSSSQKGIIALLLVGAVLILAVTGLAMTATVPFIQAATEAPTNSPVPIPSATLTSSPPTEVFTLTISPTIEPTRTLILEPNTATPFQFTPTPTETVTSTPTLLPSTPTIAPTAADTHVPTTLPNTSFQFSCAIQEIVVAPFSGGRQAAFTQNSYGGEVYLIVSGTGKAEGKRWTDAFYIYTDKAGNLISPPTHPQGGILNIDKQIVDKFLSDRLPDYSSNHVYEFSVFIPTSGRMSFGVTDLNTLDNFGSYTVAVCQR